MLPMFPVGATLPTDDPQRLRRFYEDVLGFEVRLERPGGIYFQAGEGTYFGISKSGGQASGTHTQMGSPCPTSRRSWPTSVSAVSCSRSTSRRRQSTALPEVQQDDQPGSRTQTGTSSA